MGWFFLVLSAVFSLIASRPRWRSKWGWGRNGSGPPLSVVGWVSWIAAFLTFSLCGFGFLGLYWILVAFCVVIAAGVWDSSRQRG